MDAFTGVILDELDELGIAENTIVMAEASTPAHAVLGVSVVLGTALILSPWSAIAHHAVFGVP